MTFIIFSFIFRLKLSILRFVQFKPYFLLRIMNKKISRYKRQLRLIRLKWAKRINNSGIPDYVLFSIFSIIAGGAAGLAAVLFHETIRFFNFLFFVKLLRILGFLGGIAIIFIPVLGMLIQAVMRKISPNIAKRQGILEVIKAVMVRGGYISFKTTVFHFWHRRSVSVPAVR